MLTFTNVSFAYAAASGLVLKEISLEVEPGAIVAIVGPSGCGKTTLLHLAAGLIHPGSGQVTNRFEQTAYVFQSPRLLPWRTARDNLAFGLKAQGAGAKARRATVDALLTRLGLDDAAGRYPHELSGGMRQRVALGRALAVEPQLLLMDEPFAALDVGLRRGLQDLVSELLRERRMAAILVTHDLAEALRMADELAVMAPSPGRIVYRGSEYLAGGTPDESEVHRCVAALLERPGVAEAFFGDAHQNTNRPLAGLNHGRNR